MLTRYSLVVFLAVALAITAATGIAAVAPQKAEAAGTVAVKTCGGGKIQLKTPEKRTLDRHNRTRQNRNLRPLCVNPALTRAARAHSVEMIRKDYFSHNSYSGQRFDARLGSFGYTPKGFRYYTVGENIAGGSGNYGSPDRIFNAWMKSPGHKKNILAGRFREVGIGTATGNYKGTPNYTMYTVDFGTRRR